MSEVLSAVLPAELQEDMQVVSPDSSGSPLYQLVEKAGDCYARSPCSLHGRVSVVDSEESEEDEELQEAFFDAIEMGDLDEVRRLLEDGFNKDSYFCGNTPIHCAIQNGREEILLELLSRGVNLDAENAVCTIKKI